MTAPLTADLTTELLYTCRSCGLRNVGVSVKARAADEDIVEWLRRCVEVDIARDHRTRKPRCGAAHVDVKIPIDGTDHVGGAVKQ